MQACAKPASMIQCAHAGFTAHLRQPAILESPSRKAHPLEHETWLQQWVYRIAITDETHAAGFACLSAHSTYVVAVMSKWERGPCAVSCCIHYVVDFVLQAREKEEAGSREELVYELSQLSNVRPLVSLL